MTFSDFYALEKKVLTLFQDESDEANQKPNQALIHMEQFKEFQAFKAMMANQWIQYSQPRHKQTFSMY